MYSLQFQVIMDSLLSPILTFPLISCNIYKYAFVRVVLCVLDIVAFYQHILNTMCCVYRSKSVEIHRALCFRGLYLSINLLVILKKTKSYE